VLCDYSPPAAELPAEEAEGEAAAKEEEEEARPAAEQLLLFRTSPTMAKRAGFRLDSSLDSSQGTRPEGRGGASSSSAWPPDGTGSPLVTATGLLNAAHEADAQADAQTEAGPTRLPIPPRLSVLMLMLDATSTAHFERMMPSTRELLDALKASAAVRTYTFSRYSIVGYNSIPNMVPMLAGVEAAAVLEMPSAGDS